MHTSFKEKMHSQIPEICLTELLGESKMHAHHFEFVRRMLEFEKWSNKEELIALVKQFCQPNYLNDFNSIVKSIRPEWIVTISDMQKKQILDRFYELQTIFNKLYPKNEFVYTKMFLILIAQDMNIHLEDHYTIRSHRVAQITQQYNECKHFLCILSKL